MEAIRTLLYGSGLEIIEVWLDGRAKRHRGCFEKIIVGRNTLDIWCIMI